MSARPAETTSSGHVVCPSCEHRLGLTAAYPRARVRAVVRHTTCQNRRCRAKWLVFPSAAGVMMIELAEAS